MLKEIIEEVNVSRYTRLIESNKFKDYDGNELQFWYFIKGRIEPGVFLDDLITTGGKRFINILFQPNKMKNRQQIIYSLKDFIIIDPLANLIEKDKDVDFNDKQTQLSYNSFINEGFQKAIKHFKSQYDEAKSVKLKAIFNAHTIPIWNEMVEVIKETI